MPLLIYGAELKDENDVITIDNFAEKIDQKSWEEFMPKGVTKKEFNNFIKYYDKEIFCAAGKRIRALAKSADQLDIEERIERITEIFNTFRNPDKETVLTPWRVVNIHLGESIGGYNFYDQEFEKILSEPRFIDNGDITKKIFTPNAKILEINSKSGLYPLYLVYSIYRSRLNKNNTNSLTFENKLSIWDKTVYENIFIICKTPMAKSITKRTLVGYRNAKVNTRSFNDLINLIRHKPHKFIEKVVQGKTFGKNGDNNMKFNAIVGNPPYQEEGISSRKSPVYHLFYNIAFQLSDIVTLITPARFLFKAGQTPVEWDEKMLSDQHFKIVKYFPKSTEIFPTVDIKGGVIISLRDINQNFGKINFFSPHKELTAILNKISLSNTQNNFSNLVSSQGIYKFSDILFIDHPEVYDVQGKGTAAKITSSCFEKLQNIFLEDKNDNSYIKIIGLCKGKRLFKYIKKEYIQNIDFLNYYNVLLPEANGSGALGEALSSPIISEPGSGHTDTFLSIGKFLNKHEAENCLKYICTNFTRAMLATLKATQHNPKSTWKNVPIQDFTKNSDISWDTTIDNIDIQLYKKYNLNPDEINFIEENIQKM